MAGGLSLSYLAFSCLFFSSRPFYSHTMHVSLGRHRVRDGREGAARMTRGDARVWADPSMLHHGRGRPGRRRTADGFSEPSPDWEGVSG
ncbi:hypothetical protein B0T14DRAFT_524094 [Immersiella caudata]|uniref:Uncharacterized protein n=1 Tax=Immersiella caudata TaxID=314043 RepID=A0AA39WKA8_9PEZI|nr:hypothetical protein B0T14DRAFT_524094 [Immersiella caudata]